MTATGVVGLVFAFLANAFNPALWPDGRIPEPGDPALTWLVGRNLVNAWMVSRAVVLELLLARSFSRLGDRLVAIDLLNAAHRLPDVILLDVEMPVKDGIETLREIRKSSRYGHLPVIMVTSRTGAKHRAMAREAGCNGYMGKPFNFPALVEQISELTGHELSLA